MHTKRNNIALFSFFLFLVFVARAGADTATTQADGTFDVPQVFSIAFYTDSNVLYSTGIPFSGMDSTKTWVYADGRNEGDGKSDTGCVCSSNLGVTWYLKIHAEATPPFSLDKIFYYFGQPWNRTLGAPADGQLARSANWYNLPGSPTVIYIAGNGDKINTPDGTLCTFSFAINPSQLAANRLYNCRIVYTLTTSA
ncbi:MAG: hypothetical protein PHS37_06680 [Candidatus Omnitrophica bacterium]|nr:hypothetical protein [Candidatus Omnitrophota bacterium]